MDSNLFGYIIVPRKVVAERKIHHNFQSFFLFINFFMYIVYLFTKDSSFTVSFYSDSPILFYYFLIQFCVMLHFYSKACQPPGFANDEINNDNESSQFFCKYCQINVPIRASHCLTCNKCVIRRDHHCPWTNCCIGRDNHFYYFLFTATAFISEVMPQIDAIFHFVLILRSKDDRYSNFSRIIWPYISFIAATTFASFLTFNLARQCLITVYKNLTTWERERRARISYLKDLPFGYSPFDNGFIQNFIEFCTMREKKTKWSIKPPDISLFSNELQIIIDNDGVIPD